MEAGISMTIDTPRHCQWRDLLDLRHQIDTSMACLTTDPLGDVNRVIEVDEVGKLRHSSPWNWAPRGNALSNGSHRRARHPERCVTADAFLCRRQAGERAAVDARVAVTTVDTQWSRVQPVVERNWLNDGATLTTCPRRTHPEHSKCGHGDRNGDQRNQHTSRESSRARREQCRHQLSECEASRGAERIEGCIDSAYIAPEHAACCDLPSETRFQ